MPAGSAATAAAERLLDGLRGADQYRKAALAYANAPFTKAKRGEAKSHSGDEDSIIPSLQELWHLIWKEEEKEASERKGRKPRTSGSWAAKAGGIALLITGKLLAPADAQELPPFLQLPIPAAILGLMAVACCPAPFGRCLVDLLAAGRRPSSRFRLIPGVPTAIPLLLFFV